MRMMTRVEKLLSRITINSTGRRPDTLPWGGGGIGDVTHNGV